MYELIKDLCASKGISPTKLCTEITGSKGNLPTWQKGNINPKSLIKIADYFDVSVDYLLGRTENPNCTSIKTGDINGNNNSLTDSNNINISNKKSADNISEKFMTVFNNLPFEEQLEIMNIAVEKSKKRKE